MIAAVYARPLRLMTHAGLNAVLVLGCTTSTADVIRARPEGLARIYQVPLERAWKETRAVLDEAGAQSVDERRDESLMLTLTTVGAGGLVMPTRIAVWIEAVADGTRVTVVSRQERGLLPRGLSEEEFHQHLTRRLGEPR
jgi:hypothetical protein